MVGGDRRGTVGPALGTGTAAAPRGGLRVAAGARLKLVLPRRPRHLSLCSPPAGQTTRCCTCPGTTPRPTAPGRGSGCPRRPSGSTAAGAACTTGARGPAPPKPRAAPRSGSHLSRSAAAASWLCPCPRSYLGDPDGRVGTQAQPRVASSGRAAPAAPGRPPQAGPGVAFRAVRLDTPGAGPSRKGS